MHPDVTRRQAIALVGSGLTVSSTARQLGLPVSTVRDWAMDRVSGRADECPRCTEAGLAQSAYAALLGFYLGDGCISSAARYDSLRVSCDARLPGIVDDVVTLLLELRPMGRVSQVVAPGTIVVQAHCKHWRCLFPQHGPGRKHERPIVLEPWQREVVERHPGAFLRGLFHSDGCRARNWTTRAVSGVMKRYEYPRWQFSNRSEDILRLCTWALDLVDVPWRRSARWCVSVSRREAVARLDQLIGVKA